MTARAPSAFLAAQSGRINAFDNPDLFDTYTLAGARAPGVVKFKGHDSFTDWDVKQASGTSGSTMTRKGDKPVEFTATHYLVNDPVAGDYQQEAWDAFAKLIESSVSGAKPKALDIVHPDLARNKIRSVVKSRISGFEYDGKGGATVVVTYKTYEPPKAKLATGPAGGSKTKDQKAIDAFNDGLAAINELLSQGQKPQSQQTLSKVSG